MRAFAFFLAASAFVQGCWLTDFTIEPGTATGGSPGVGGNASGGGGGLLAGGGDGLGGRGPEVGAPVLREDSYVFLQGSQAIFSVAAANGVLSNDAPVGLEVVASSDTDPLRPSSFDAKVLSVSADGSFQFQPQPRFFGVYRFTYTARNARDLRGESSVQIRVVPTHIDLDAVLEGIGGYVLYGPESGGLGSSLDRAFDVNRDGLRDLVLGAPSAASGDGAAFVVFGKADLDPIALTPLPAGSRETRYVSLSAGPAEGLGISVAGVDDLDGDSAGDVVIGSEGGLGRVYLASSSVLAGSVALPGIQQAILEGDSANTEVGRIVRGVGDVNGDALQDFLVSSKNALVGWVHVLFGRVGSSGRTTITRWPGLHTRAAPGDDQFPLAAAGVGDLDGDGCAEVLLGSGLRFALLNGGVSYPSSLDGLKSDGRDGGYSLIRTAAGDAPVTGLSDVNGDSALDFGYCDGFASCTVVLGPPAVLGAGWTMRGLNRRERPVSIAGGGDLDGDKLSDVLLADGRTAYVVYGRRAGFDDIDLGALGSAGYSIRAASGGNVTALSVIGDANGDGVDDFAIADSGADSGAGRVYVVFGVRSY